MSRLELNVPGYTVALDDEIVTAGIDLRAQDLNPLGAGVPQGAEQIPEEQVLQDACAQA